MPLYQTDHLTLETQDEQGAILTLHVADKSVNVFTRQVLADLDAALDRAAEAEALSAQGQQVFQKLADLRTPTVAVIQGPCLGGGLEFALACDYRLVIDHPKTQLGLPEIELGLLPAWGGTQRLPRVIGIERALQVIIGRKRLKAREAYAWGLADALATDTATYQDQMKQLMAKALTLGKPNRRRLPLRTGRQRLLESTAVGRWLLFRGAERILRRRTPDDMPAPHEAFRAVRTGIRDGMEAGWRYEREAVGRLALTPACRNLVTLFFLIERAKKPEGADASTIRKVGVVGAGTMGAGIAQLAAIRDFNVVVQEVNDGALQAGMKKIEDLFTKAAQRGVLPADEAKAKVAAMGQTTSWPSRPPWKISTSNAECFASWRTGFVRTRFWPPIPRRFPSRNCRRACRNQSAWPGCTFSIRFTRCHWSKSCAHRRRVMTSWRGWSPGRRPWAKRRWWCATVPASWSTVSLCRT